MGKQHSSTLTFNRGLLSKLGIARSDISRYALSAEVFKNWMPRVLGSMMLRPGWQYLGSTKNNAKSKSIPFVFSIDDVALLEVTQGTLRVRVADALITRSAVTAVVTNGNFNADVTGWTDSDEAGATSQWLTGGYLSLVGTGTNAAIRDQQVTVNEAGTEHALRIVIARGPVVLRVGSTSGGDDYVAETTLGTGTHSLAFTPAGTVYIRVQNARLPTALVDSITVEAAGIMELPTPWLTNDLSLLRTTPSGDVIYVACKGYPQRKFERRGLHSWSVVLYQPEDGPFRILNTSPITLTPSAVNGDITLTASKPLFRSTHVGALFRLASTGQLVTASITGADQFSDPIRVAGISDQRKFQIAISGTWTATVHLQYSVGAPGSWVDVKNWTGNTTNETYGDGLDNQIIYYRIGIKSGNYTSGTAVVTLSFASGSITGVVRITGYTNATTVTAAVLKALGGTTGSGDWSEGVWSDRRGWPSAVALHEGRVWWPGKDKIQGSESDGYEQFNDETIGDAGPISRSIGEGPVDTINWVLSLGRLILGTASNSAPISALRIDGNNPIAARSDSLDEPLTPTNFNMKVVSTKGVYVDRSFQRVFEIAYDASSADFKTEDLTLVVPDLNKVGIVHIAVQHKPDVRIHCLRADGTAGVVVIDRAENVICWIEAETDGVIEDVAVLPGTGEDQVYYTVQRTLGSGTVRYHERWALEDDCQGGILNKQADAFVISTGAPRSTITGLAHLEGKMAIVWADGADQGSYRVTGGSITLPVQVSSAVVGLGYTAQWKSMKQAFGAAMGTPFNQKKKIDGLGLILVNTHCQGLKYGNSFDAMDSIPLDDVPMIAGEPDLNHIFESYDSDMFEFDDEWSTDSRLCLQAAAPRPVTVACATISLEVNG